MRRAASALMGVLLLAAVAAPAAAFYRQTTQVTARVRVAVLPAPVRLPDRTGNTGVDDGTAPAWRVSGARTSLLLERRDTAGVWRPVAADDEDVVVECGEPDARLDRTCTARPRTPDPKGTAAVDAQEQGVGAAPIRARAVLGTWESEATAAVVPQPAGPERPPTGTVQGESTGAS